MDKLFKKEKEWSFVKKWHHWEMIKKWKTIIKFEDWSTFDAPYNSIIILPKHGDRKIWDEWFYLWVEEK